MIKTAQRESAIDRSGTITAGATAQDAAVAFVARTYFLFQNISDTDMYLRFGATATAGAGSILLKAGGGSWENPPHFCPTGRASVLCATTGKAFTCIEA